MIPRHLQIAFGILLLAVLGMGFYVGRIRGRAQQAEPAADSNASHCTWPTTLEESFARKPPASRCLPRASNVPRNCCARCSISTLAKTRRIRSRWVLRCAQSTWSIQDWSSLI